MGHANIKQWTASTDPLSILWTWATRHENGSSHSWHAHAGSLLSGIYFVKCPEESGNLVFADPRGLHDESVDSDWDMMERHPFGGNAFQVRPTAGRLVLFPSWLLHKVAATMGSEARTSIAFNLDAPQSLGSTAWETTGVISAVEPGVAAALGEYMRAESDLPTPLRYPELASAAGERDEEDMAMAADEGFIEADRNADGFLSKDEFRSFLREHRVEL
eukprot:TRINITY_DN41116_c0_g1_i1.p1 TRINITY_DN41116_c0_g1~~TRINITY_DN41116_c0_g1_i1.p1  ORF type:complete len:241 (+),score=55.75 TRINITY_DN41116_c0_g1_i1:70-723(+)